MITNSSAIVLKRFPYGESSIIARCFVKNNGKLSFIVHGARRKKSPRSAHFQPINCLDLVYYYKPSKNLQTISKSSFACTWKNIPQNFKKITSFFIFPLSVFMFHYQNMRGLKEIGGYSFFFWTSQALFSLLAILVLTLFSKDENIQNKNS